MRKITKTAHRVCFEFSFDAGNKGDARMLPLFENFVKKGGVVVYTTQETAGLWAGRVCMPSTMQKEYYNL